MKDGKLSIALVGLSFGAAFAPIYKMHPGVGHLIHWTRCAQNPILPVTPGGWDSRFASDPCMLRDGKRWLMFYYGYDGRHAQDGLTVSEDLTRWEKAAQPLLTYGAPGSLDSIHACVDEVMARYGKIDVLFNVAGINKREGLLDVEEADYDRIMDTNLKGLFFMSQAVAREMYKRRTGSIVNIGSHNDEGMLGGCSVYGATKSGVVALTRAMAVEFAQYGIRANAISPGHILTDLTQVTWDHPTRAPWLRERIAMRRPGDPDELVGMAILLASDASSYMTGQAYHIDGGCLCGGAPWDYDTQYKA